MSTAACEWCGRMLWPDIPHTCSGTYRLALLESLVTAARAWDASGNWRDGQALHEAIAALDKADA